MKEHPVKSQLECCMCGDLGLSEELFHCKICHFRSQHRYCSNLYPKAEFYRVCNWCLSKTKTDKTLSTPSIKDDRPLEEEIKNRDREFEDHEGVKKEGQVIQPVLSGLPQRLPERTRNRRRRRIITNGELEEKLRLRRTKSEEMMKQNQVVRNKVRLRRYKLLDEVSNLRSLL